ncbi:hypothetical protein TNCV_600761 [Trichonephila clavipes]|nr:hypothetical protein TNCV_600761 [Trichonephila clavipes]
MELGGDFSREFRFEEFSTQSFHKLKSRPADSCHSGPKYSPRGFSEGRESQRTSDSLHGGSSVALEIEPATRQRQTQVCNHDHLTIEATRKFDRR